MFHTAGSSCDFPGPHSLRECANDVVRLAQRLRVPIDGIVGHSLGGKIALQLLHDHADHPVGRATPLPHGHGHHADSVPVRHPSFAKAADARLQVVLLDAMPGVWNQLAGDTDRDSVMKVLQFLHDTPLPLPGRPYLRQAVARAGFSPLVAE